MAAIWSWLNTPPGFREVLDPFGALYLIVFSLGFVVSAYLAGPGADWLARNPIQLAGIQHWAAAGLWIFGAGLFFFGMRALQINPLSFGEPIWMVASVIALLIAVVRCAEWWRTVYPAELAAHVPSVTGVHHQQFASTGGNAAPTSAAANGA